MFTMFIQELMIIGFCLIVFAIRLRCMDVDDNQLVALEDEDDEFNGLNKVNTDFERIDPSHICQVPKYAPYLTVLRTSRYEIEFNVTDINPPDFEPSGYTIYYWGFRLGPKSSYRSEDRHFGHKNFTTDGPFVLQSLKPKFSYCADLTSFNRCGHSPFCMGCFEQVLTI